MKSKIYKSILFAVLIMFSIKGNAQGEYGSTLNIGLGAGGNYGYYHYVGTTFPMLHIDYEFDVAKNFTIAPLINIYSYRRSYHEGNPRVYYYYHERAVQLGAKGTYYFDDILHAGSNWDFYMAGSLGFTFVKTSWDDGYPGDRTIYARTSPLYLDIHLGTEYHFNDHVGMFLDLSTGVNTIGIAIH